jgi:hypothetical protein
LEPPIGSKSKNRVCLNLKDHIISGSISSLINSEGEIPLIMEFTCH